ncbi:MAG: hypothetical protein V1921_02970 [Candidatus Altiarchaeota archaeon]
MEELKRLKGIEAGIARDVETAKADGGKDVKKARASRDEIVGRKKADAEAKASSQIEAASKKAQAESERIISQAGIRAKELELMSKKNFDKAVRLVLDELIG